MGDAHLVLVYQDQVSYASYIIQPFLFSRPASSQTLCPDLVEQPGLTEESKKSRPQLFSSLPDVSSIGRCGEVGKLEDGTHKSTESLNFPPAGTSTENPEFSDEDMDLGDLDSELDTQFLEQSHSLGGQQIPDCIVESVMNDDHQGDERPVAFSESIGQRTRRERTNMRSGFDQMEPSDLVKDANQSESKAKEKEKTKEDEAGGLELVKDELENRMPKILDFVGDWPSEGSLKQRQVKRGERRVEGNEEEVVGLSQEVNECEMTVQSGPDVTLFQKLLDNQVGVAAFQTNSSSWSSHSPNFTEELVKEEETSGFEELYCSRSSSEEREKNINSSGGELPDCVLDWKVGDSRKDRKPTIDNQEELKTENEASSNTESNIQTSADLKLVNRLNTVSAFSADSLANAKAAQTNMSDNEVGSQNIENEVGTEPDDGGHFVIGTINCTDDGRDTKTEANSSHFSEECQSPVCEGSLEADNSNVGSQERKLRHGRRSGKLCKLALTFTQNCPSCSVTTLEHPSTTPENTDCSQIISVTEFEPNSSSNLEPSFDLFMDSKSEAKLQPHFSHHLVDTGCFTQTEPQDFALLWRLNHQDGSNSTVVTVCSHSSDFTSLSGDSSRFVPELASAVSAAVAVDPAGQTEIPYRVVHEKGTQVEEKELGVTQDRLESLRILSSHFKLVSFDTLEDLYDKCHQDLDWTTNLLLDSGERFFKDEDGAGSGFNQNTSNLCQTLADVGTSLCGIVLDECHSEDLPKARPAECESTSGTVSETNEGSSNTEVGNEDYPDTSSHMENGPQTELSLPEEAKEREKCTELKVMSEPDREVDAWGGSLDDAVVIEESTLEIQNEIASMDEVHRLLQAELEEMEREETQNKEERTQRWHMEERRSQHLDIQTLELNLPTELALQLTELFGPVGVNTGN